jgi:hypothetical protein
MGVGNVSEIGVSVTCGRAVKVSVGRFVGEGMGVDVLEGTRVAVGGAEVDEAGTTVGLALSVAKGVDGGGVVVGSVT